MLGEEVGMPSARADHAPLDELARSLGAAAGERMAEGFKLEIVPDDIAVGGRRLPRIFGIGLPGRDTGEARAVLRFAR